MDFLSSTQNKRFARKAIYPYEMRFEAAIDGADLVIDA